MLNSGVYCIKNVTNNKKYVGSTINLKKREYLHFITLKNNNHTNENLQKDYNEFGKEGFVFEVLEFCEVIENKDFLLEREQYYLNSFSDLYNVSTLSTGANNSEYHKTGKRSKYKAGSRVSFRISIDCDQKTLDYINSIENMNEEIYMLLKMTSIDRSYLMNKAIREHEEKYHNDGG